jgi:hypothetical protein
MDCVSCGDAIDVMSTTNSTRKKGHAVCRSKVLEAGFVIARRERDGVMTLLLDRLIVGFKLLLLRSTNEVRGGGGLLAVRYGRHHVKTLRRPSRVCLVCARLTLSDVPPSTRTGTQGHVPFDAGVYDYLVCLDR